MAALSRAGCCGGPRRSPLGDETGQPAPGGRDTWPERVASHLEAGHQNGNPQGIATLRYPDGCEEIQVFRGGKIVRSMPKEKFEAEQRKRKQQEAQRQEQKAKRQEQKPALAP